MNFTTIKQEIADRGFSDLTDARLGVYANYARAEFDLMALWPWREESTTGLSPLTVTNLAVIEAVTNETLDVRLPAIQFRDALDAFGDLSTTGSPSYYYVSRPAGSPVVATYPVSASDVIGVQFWRTSPTLVSGSDEPLSPVECHYLIVDLAVRRASRDVGDHTGAEAIQSEIDRQIDALTFNFAPGVADDPGHMISPGPGWNW